jgi:general secretion pathway protein D
MFDVRQEVAMIKVLWIAIAGLVISVQTVVGAETSDQPKPEGVALSHVLERAAERLNKNFIVDPRLNSQVRLIGIDPERLSYRELQAVLEVHGFITVEDGGLIKIVPDANSRQTPTPVVTDRNPNLGDDEVITKTLDVGSLEATQLVPILRPMLPQYAHLVAHGQTNTLIVVARHANVRTLEAILNELKKRPSVGPTKTATAKE